MSPSIEVVDFSYFLFLLIPGYVSLRGYLAGNVALDDLSRTDKLMIIILGGVVSFVLVVEGHRLNFFELVTWVYDSITGLHIASGEGVMKEEVMIDDTVVLSVTTWSKIITAQSLVGGTLAWIVGRVVMDGNSRSHRVLRQPWEEVTKHAARGDPVTVVTCNDLEFQGEIEQMGSPSESCDVLVAGPSEIHRGEEEESEPERQPRGEHMYFNEGEISHIEFHEEFDKQSKPPWSHAPIQETRRRINDRKKRTVAWFRRLSQSVRSSRDDYDISVENGPDGVPAKVAVNGEEYDLEELAADREEGDGDRKRQ